MDHDRILGGGPGELGGADRTSGCTIPSSFVPRASGSAKTTGGQCRPVQRSVHPQHLRAEGLDHGGQTGRTRVP